MVWYQSTNGKGILLPGDSGELGVIPRGSVAVIVTSPPYWVRGRGRASASRYASQFATRFAREWRRVLHPRGALWLLIGDRHDGREWIGLDGLVVDSLRRAGWVLQAKGVWAEHPSRARWDDRINYLLRFGKTGHVSLPPDATLCWRLPIPWSPPGSRWDATPPPVLRALLKLSPKGSVLDPFFGAGTLGAVAARLGRPWVGVERDQSQIRVAARRLGLERCVSRDPLAVQRALGRVLGGP